MPIHHPLESNNTLWKMLVYNISLHPTNHCFKHLTNEQILFPTNFQPGDLAYADTDASRWDRFHRLFDQHGCAEIPWLVLPGNHDGLEWFMVWWLFSLHPVVAVVVVVAGLLSLDCFLHFKSQLGKTGI